MSQIAKLELLLQEYPKKHIIFDFDETLFRVHPDRSEYKKQIRQEMESIDGKLAGQMRADGKTRAWDAVDVFTRMYWQQARDKVIAVTAKIESELQKATEKHQELLDFIRENKDRYSFHIRSSNLVQTFKPIIEKEGLLDSMSTLVWKDTIELVKQYPDGFYHIHALHGGEKKDYLMVGNDQERDGGWATRAGIDFFWIDPSKVEWGIRN